MNNIEFLSFTKTPSEKYLGVATIRYERKFIFRYKIMQNPKGEGYFLNAPSIKVDEQYYPAFALDSTYEADEVKRFILTNVKLALQPVATQVSPSPFQQPQELNFNFEQTPF